MDAVKFIKEKKRMCNSYSKCVGCPVDCDTKTDCEYYLTVNPEQYVKIVEKWSSEHPVETRQSKFLKAYPNADITEGVLFICPRRVDLNCLSEEECKEIICPECMKKYWLSKEE